MRCTGGAAHVYWHCCEARDVGMCDIAEFVCEPNVRMSVIAECVSVVS